MTQRAPHPCQWPGCGRLVDGPGNCEAHRKQARKDSDSRRVRTIVYGARWQRIRALHLHRHPLCRECESAGRIEPATDVDHVIPHKGNEALFYAPANLQSLCHSCHSRKTAREDGGFGHAPRA